MTNFLTVCKKYFLRLQVKVAVGGYFFCFKDEVCSICKCSFVFSSVDVAMITVWFNLICWLTFIVCCVFLKFTL